MSDLIDSYAELDEKNILVINLIKFHFDTILTSLNRKIQAKQTLYNPFKVVINERVHSEIFLAVYKAIRDFRTAYGRELIVKKDKSGIIKEISIIFHHLGSLKFHLSNLSSLDINKIFKKKFKSNAVGDIICDDEKKCILHYKVSTKTLNITASYKVVNQYGMVCSY